MSSDNASNNVDLSSDTAVRLIRQESVSLDVQIYNQRNIVFWITVVVCLFLFVCFFYHFFWTDFFRTMMEKAQYSGVIALSLLVVPSFLLWGLVRAVYKIKGDEAESNAIKEAVKSHPLT